MGAPRWQSSSSPHGVSRSNVAGAGESPDLNIDARGRAGIASCSSLHRGLVELDAEKVPALDLDVGVEVQERVVGGGVEIPED